jgi:hypothetical protein
VLSPSSRYMRTVFCILIGFGLAATQAVGQLNVVYFLSPTCPICKFYTIEMKSIVKDYADYGVVFSACAVGPLLTDSAVVAFQSEYQLPFQVQRDDSLHRVLNATVTPEVFVLRDDVVLYHGRIDDSYVRVGKRRAHVKNKELRHALDSVLKTGAPIFNTHVPAIGCIIEK